MKETPILLLCFLLVFPCVTLSQITETKIIAYDGSEAEYFGFSVSIDGHRAIVGASSAYSYPSHYIYHLEGDVWIADEKLTRSNSLGSRSRISGEYILVGGDCDSAHVYRLTGTDWFEEASLVHRSPEYCRTALSIVGDLALIGVADESVHVFKRTGTDWIHEASLASGQLPEVVAFGGNVSITSGRALVSASSSDEHGEGSGSAYIFRREETTWVEEAQLSASDASSFDYFGSSVSISGDYAIIGASGADDYGEKSGAAYVFRRDGTSWVEEARLTPSDGAAYGWFGSSVSISGDYAIVGAWGLEAAYLYKRSGIDWIEHAKLSASDGHENNKFGYSVSISGNHAIVGAYFDINQNGWEAGAAYIYTGFAPNCDDYTNFLTRCGEGQAVKARVVLLNNIAHSGETVLFDIDGTSYPATIVDNGISSRASISVPGLGTGPHTVSVLDPAGCFSPRVVSCGPPGSEDLEWEEDEARWRVELSREETHTPPATRLLGNHPNPFNPSTTINYELDQDAMVTLKIYNVLGEEVATLVNEVQAPGYKSAIWNGTNEAGSQVASGIYIYRLTTGSQIETGRMMLVK
jgi:hypothetical protein